MFWKRRTYLDYASGAESNPSSPHEEGRAAKKMLEDARLAIARLLEVKADDVVFTSGATEANNSAIRGLTKRGVHMLYLPSSHASIVQTMEALVAEQQILAEPLPIKGGKVDVLAMRNMLRPETSLISMDAVCGETGTIWNTREVATALRRHDTKIYLHVDASQAPMSEKFSRSHFDADMVTLDASKVGGPRGIGALIAHRTIPLAPIMTGGGQERALRPGSEAPHLAREFAAALAASAAGCEAFKMRAAAARDALVKALAPIPELYINVGAQGVPQILNISLPGRDTDYLVALLDEAGFAVSTKSACETDSEEGSRAVMALTSDPERAKATLRISWGPATTERNLRSFAAALAKAVHFVDMARHR